MASQVLVIIGPDYGLTPGPWFNMKMSSYQYRKSHCGDKTVVRLSYLHNGISYTGKMSSLYWIKPRAHFQSHTRPITGQVTSVTYPVIGWAYSEQDTENGPCKVPSRHLNQFWFLVNDIWIKIFSIKKTNLKMCPQNVGCFVQASMG